MRQRGIEVVRCEEVGLAEADDIEHLVHAAQNDLSVITKDADFLRLHAEWLSQDWTHCGIFYCPDRDKSAIGAIVSTCIEYYGLIAGGAGTVDDDIHNHVIYI